MSDFEKETDQALALVHSNPRRNGVITTIGYIVTEEQARAMVNKKAATHSRSAALDALVIFLMCLVLAATGVAVLG